MTLQEQQLALIRAIIIEYDGPQNVCQWNTYPPDQVVICDNEGHIVELDFTSWDITGLPPEIGQLPYLESLNLYAGSLENLPPEIGQLSHLKRLILYGNNLESLPPEIGLLSALEELNLVGNRLTSLPSEIGQLSSLEQLNLDLNPLTSLSPEICATLANVITPRELCP